MKIKVNLRVRTFLFLHIHILPISVGVLQIPWSEVLNTFDGIYLSWDPKMWERQLTFHG
jgi:uncharacterized protein YpmS